jgi:hypothetical protein
MQQDNQTLLKKVQIRMSALKEVRAPVVLETHGGIGSVYRRCYSDAKGVVFEKDPKKTEMLASQRPSWRVYECDCVEAINAGVCGETVFNMIDIDPYGQCWPVIDAVFGQGVKMADRTAIVVNCGLRQNLKMGTAWNAKSMQWAVTKYGNAHVYGQYLDICREAMENKAAQAGYSLRRWAGYHCGVGGNMTHFLAVIEKTQ